MKALDAFFRPILLHSEWFLDEISKIELPTSIARHKLSAELSQ
jgi:hypothetical protein